jgi:hypothetical protein
VAARRELLGETTTLRRALLNDKPPARAEAQRRARELVATRPVNAREWWRFEGESMLDCVLMTDRLVVTIEGKRTGPISATTDWYPKRSQLVRNLEAAKQLAHGRQWCSMLISEHPIPEGSDASLADVLDASAPHLDRDEQRQLASRYLGNLTWQQACDAVGRPFSSLPTTSLDI